MSKFMSVKKEGDEELEEEFEEEAEEFEEEADEEEIYSPDDPEFTTYTTNINSERNILIKETQFKLDSLHSTISNIHEKLTKLETGINDVKNVSSLKLNDIRVYLASQEKEFEIFTKKYSDYCEDLRTTLIIDDLSKSKTISIYEIPTVQMEIDNIDSLIAKSMSSIETLSNLVQEVLFSKMIQDDKEDQDLQEAGRKLNKLNKGTTVYNYYTSLDADLLAYRSFSNAEEPKSKQVCNDNTSVVLPNPEKSEEQQIHVVLPESKDPKLQQVHNDYTFIVLPDSEEPKSQQVHNDYTFLDSIDKDDIF